MPNWSFNALLVHNDDLDKIVSGEDKIDFNRWKPMPESLMVTFGSVSKLAEKLYSGQIDSLDERALGGFDYYRDGEQVRVDCPTPDDVYEFGKLLHENQAAYGFSNWYDWRCAIWGTKWNGGTAHLSKVDDAHTLVEFDTAWCPPMGVLGDMLCRR